MLLPMLSERFPRMDIEYKNMVDSDDTKATVAPRKKQALAATKEGAPTDGATPLSVGRAPEDVMDEASDADDAGDDE